MEGGTAEDVTEPRWSREEVDLSTAPVFLSLVFSSVTGLSDVGSLFDSLTVNVWMTWRKKQNKNNSTSRVWEDKVRNEKMTDFWKGKSYSGFVLAD